SGEDYFDLNDWISGSGGTWENWYIEGGTLTRTYDQLAPSCITGIQKEENNLFLFYPNPAVNELRVELLNSFSGKWQISDLTGRIVLSGDVGNDQLSIDISNLRSGAYALMLQSDQKLVSSPFLKTR